jgi:hypothetical protein
LQQFHSCAKMFYLLENLEVKMSENFVSMFSFSCPYYSSRGKIS